MAQGRLEKKIDWNPENNESCKKTFAVYLKKFLTKKHLGAPEVALLIF